jgi:prepilin-type N-terminal cleavage/methylation domain-containing protein
MKRKAFTLIELLITALLFVIVAGYAVVIFSSTVGLSSQAQRSAGAAGQSRQAIDVLSRAFAQSSTSAPVAVLRTTESGTDGSVLVFTVTIPTNLGAASATTEQRIYCANPVGNGTFRLAQFIATGSYSGAVGSVACNGAALTALFSGGTITGPTFITDTNTNVTRFSAVPAQYNTGVPTPNPSGLRLLLTTLFDPTVGNASAQTRTDSAGTSLPITVEATATRNFPYARSSFSGL